MSTSKNEQHAAAPNSNLSIVALVLAFVFPIAGLVVSFLAKKEIETSGGKKGGSQLVRLSFILSIVFIVIQVIAVVFWSVLYFQALQEASNIQDQMNDIFNDLETGVPEVCYDAYLDEYTEEACF